MKIEAIIYSDPYYGTGHGAIEPQVKYDGALVRIQSDHPMYRNYAQAYIPPDHTLKITITVESIERPKPNVSIKNTL